MHNPNYLTKVNIYVKYMAKLQYNSTIMITRANVMLPWQDRQTDRQMCRQDFQLNCYTRSNDWLSETTQHEMTEHINVHLALLLAYINVSAQMDNVNVTGNAEVQRRKYWLLCFYNLFFMSVLLNYSLTHFFVPTRWTSEFKTTAQIVPH